MYKLNFRNIINNVRKPGASLTHRVVISGFWVFTFRILQKAFGLIRLIVLARILAPDDFGLLGIALLTMSTLETFSQTGFQQALIQKKENIDPYLNSAWTFLTLRGFILFGILYFIAPYAATFFNAIEAKSIIRIIGISVLIQAFTNIGIIYFKKELEFNKQFIYELVGTLTDFIVSVSVALILRNVWALVFGLLAGDFAMCCLSHFLHPHRPHINFDLGKLKELWGFGRWISGSNIFAFLITQGDDIFVGKLLGATSLGFYQMAYKISNLPATEITHATSQITFPAYSKLQDNLQRLREAYLKVFQIITFLSFPAAGLIFLLASDFTRIFLGEKWMPMVPAMQVLALWGVIRSVGATTGPVFNSIGKPGVAAKLQFIQLILLMILIYPFTMRLGFLGTSISVLLAALIPSFVACFMVIRLTSCEILNFSRLVLLPLINTSIIVASIFAIKVYFTTGINLLVFFVFIMMAFIAYIGIASLFNKFLNYEIWSILDTVSKTIRQ